MAEVAAAAGSMAAGPVAGSIAGRLALRFMAQEPDASLAFLTPPETEARSVGPRVAIARTRGEFVRWLRDPAPDVAWLRVDGLIGDQDVWAMAAQGTSTLALDVILTDPAKEFSSLYRLVDVRLTRNVRVTMPARPGFMKAL